MKSKTEDARDAATAVALETDLRGTVQDKSFQDKSFEDKSFPTSH